MTFPAFPPFSHPDFELYDNVGRTTEQIHSYNTGEPTEDDKRRWADPDRPGPAGDGITPWTKRLQTCSGLESFQDITYQVCGSESSAVSRLQDFLKAAAGWCQDAGQEELAQRYWDVCDALDRIAEDLTALDHDLSTVPEPARSHNVAPTAAPGTAPTPPAHPPAPPGGATPPTGRAR
ncbi:hypothetical protein [Streptomyces sp. YIM 98790]|uniref:hypothetical protein n=1 Tax=Streptomyces sp. YIM 98790 TaxID=2689077 RepID=UPI00140C016F|nr:hypothetical protein [Streptomyces sp. YIM 98790]